MKEAGNSKVSGGPKYYSGGGEDLLFMGNEVGRVAVYRDNHDDEAFELLIDDLLIDRYGRRITIDVADIDNDGYLELLAGNERGGLNLFNTTIQVSGLISKVSQEQIALETYLSPNPVEDILFIKDIIVPINKIMIYNEIGQLISRGELNDNTLNVASLKSGIYFAQLISKGQIITRKFIKI